MRLNNHEIEAVMDAVTFAIPFFYHPHENRAMEDSDYFSEIGLRVYRHDYNFSEKDLAYICLALTLFISRNNEANGIHEDTLERFSKMLPPDLLALATEKVDRIG